jgi:hypothetical protein
MEMLRKCDAEICGEFTSRVLIIPQAWPVILSSLICINKNAPVRGH